MTEESEQTHQGLDAKSTRCEYWEMLSSVLSECTMKRTRVTRDQTTGERKWFVRMGTLARVGVVDSKWMLAMLYRNSLVRIL